MSEFNLARSEIDTLAIYPEKYRVFGCQPDVYCVNKAILTSMRVSLGDYSRCLHIKYLMIFRQPTIQLGTRPELKLRHEIKTTTQLVCR